MRNRARSGPARALQCTSDMKRLLAAAPLALVIVPLVHCAPAAPPAQSTFVLGDAAPPRVAVVTTPAQPGDRHGERFPGGPGTTLVDDALNDALRDATIRDGRQPQAARIAAAQKLFGVEGSADGGDWVFRAVAARTILGPYGCRELRIKPTYTSVGPTDHRGCGLPYLSQTGTDWHPGAGPRWTVARLRRVASELATRPDATKELSRPDVESATERAWYGIGARDEDGPVTCWVLRVGATTNAAQVSQVGLATCDIAWPPPASAFERGAEPAPVAIQDKRDACNACDPAGLCLIDETTPKDAQPREADGKLRATYLDGRPAPVTASQTCIARPAGWAPVPMGMNGVCPSPGYHGLSVVQPRGQAPVVTCMRWTP